MCKYCENEVDLLAAEVEELDDIFLTFADDRQQFTAGHIRTFYDINQVRVFYDRGYLRLTKGEDVGCLDHSEDRIKINFCPICGNNLS